MNSHEQSSQLHMCAVYSEERDQSLRQHCPEYLPLRGSNDLQREEALENGVRGLVHLRDPTYSIMIDRMFEN